MIKIVKLDQKLIKYKEIKFYVLIFEKDFKKL